MVVKNPELLPLFADVKKLLEPYAAQFPARKDEPGGYELWSDTPVEVAGRSRKEGVFFAGVLLQKHYVGFYYMPYYTHEEAAAVVGPDLMKLLKGKSCFYIKKLTPQIAEQITAALDEGVRLYRERGWV